MASTVLGSAVAWWNAVSREMVCGISRMDSVYFAEDTAVPGVDVLTSIDVDRVCRSSPMASAAVNL